MSTTSDLSKFGMRELKELELTLKYWREGGLPEGFGECDVTPMLNVDSGYVFLTDENFNVCMINYGKLEQFHSCGECGHEGFREDVIGHGENEECVEWERDVLGSLLEEVA